MLALAWRPVRAEGPLARAIPAEAARLAAEPVRLLDNRASWRVVRLLEPGTAIVITTADSIVTGRFSSIDDRAIAVSHGADVERVGLDDVFLVEQKVRRGSSVAAVLGTLGGIWLGSVIAVDLAFNDRCQPSCGGVEVAMLLSALGLPIAAGYGAWRGTSHVTEEVIYRRAPASQL